ncbi:bud site selection protein 22 [Arthroderma uncinatum]|uniref:bud site selection protein 22 n=1 Tax=Arthroderma uncinatum TaxID=74035 RepID=UPI00144A4D2D|nr:bud site selection protein 22 [Arthroderma uncinatum]KAF3491359.1 bud site selection protein 22 [Arthroderma uncinatum]
MAKRKRDAPEGDDSYNWGDKKLRLQRLRLEQKVQHGVVLLHRALKVARGFERQKLGRREKTARQESDRMLLNRHMNEVEALKALDLHKTAERYLIKQMTKTKRIAESPAFIHLKLADRIAKNEEKKSDAEANVTARLFNSNPVKKVFPGLMNEIRDILGLSGDQPPKKKGTIGDDKQPTQPADEDVEMSDDEGINEESDASQGSEEEDLSRFDGLVASGSDEDDESAQEEDDMPKPTTAKYNPIADLSLSPTPSIASDDSAEITTKTSKTKQKSTTATTATTFLPTLMGGYWSGSESEPENDDPSALPVRKNRMGQQARRKLWEKKYGASAKHIQNQAKEQYQSKNRDSGWDMRRGATSQEDTRGKYGRNKIPGGKRREVVRSSAPQEQPARPASNFKKPNDDKPLHPSWQAAMKRKETKTQAAFQGKKVVFD